LHPPLPSRQAPPTADVAPSFPILEQRAETTLEDYVAGIVWAPDSRQFAVAGGEGQVFLGNITASGLSARPIGEHLLGVLDIAWQPKGEHLATAGQDGTVALWNAAGQEAKRWRPAPVTTDRLAFAPGGQLLATASGRHANVWNAQGELVHAFPPAAKAIAGLAFDKSGQHLGAASVGEVAVHRIDSHNYQTRRFLWDAPCLTVSFSPNGKFLAAGVADGSVHFWYLNSAKDSQMRGYGSRVTWTGFSCNSRYLGTCAGTDLIIWDFGGKGPEGSKPIQLTGHTDQIECLAWHPDGPYLVSGGRDWRVSLWCPGKTAQALDAQLAGSEVTAVAWSPDGRQLAVGEKSGQMTIYQLVLPVRV